MPSSDLDIYQRFELEVRTPRRRLLVDALLPSPESIPSVVAPLPPPPRLPGEGPEEINLGSLRDREEPAPEPPPRPRRKKTGPTKIEKPKSLQEEIDEFMHRDRTALTPDDDAGLFQAPPPDPKPDPDPKSGSGSGS